MVVICKMLLQPALASAWQYPGQSSGLPIASSAAPERTGSLSSLSSLQAATMQCRSFVVTTGDVVIRSTSEQLDQPEASCQVRLMGHLRLAYPGSVSSPAWHASWTADADNGMGAVWGC